MLKLRERSPLGGERAIAFFISPVEQAGMPVLGSVSLHPTYVLTSGGRSLYSIVSLFLIGRGGLSPNPTQAFTINSPLIEWAPPQPELSTEYKSQREYIQDVSNSPLVEATGWTIDEYGKITLVAQAPKATPTVQGLTHPTCR